jgi:hypothetical protein
MAEPELPTSSASTSTASTTSVAGSSEQGANQAGPSQVATSSGNVATVGEGSGDGGVAGTDQQAEEDMSVQVDAAGAGNDQSEDMVIESGPSHIGKRVKVRLLHMTKSAMNANIRCTSSEMHHGSIEGRDSVKVYTMIHRI